MSRTGPYANDATQVNIRLEPEVVEALDRLRRGNRMSSRGETARLLLRRGIAAVVEGQGRPLAPPPGEGLSSDAFAALVQAHLQALSAVLTAREPRDPVAAVLAARGVETAARDWADDRASSYGLGLPADERVAQLADSLAVLVRSAPPEDRLPLWSAVLGAVSARAREEHEALTDNRSQHVRQPI